MASEKRVKWQSVKTVAFHLITISLLIFSQISLNLFLGEDFNGPIRTSAYGNSTDC
jgi:hypothetical protein